MGILESIEKLINEHGSATILRERLVFVKDQCIALDSENAILKSDNHVLKEENHRLQKENIDLKGKIDNLPKAGIKQTQLIRS